MPFNSQSPFILKLNALFSAPQAKGLQSSNLRPKMPKPVVDLLVERAQARGVVPTTSIVQQNHIKEWPADHQTLLRELFVVSIDEDLPISFAWEEAATFRTIIVSFGTNVGVTFRSPYY